MTAGRSIVIRTAGAVWNLTESDGTASEDVLLLDADGRTYSVRRNGMVPTRLSSGELQALLGAVEEAV